jgi:hypothetical protein
LTVSISSPAQVSVILPCAGAGRRFQAPYPKELHCVAPGVSAVDQALAPVLDLTRQGVHVRVVAVVNAEKLAVARHLDRYGDSIDFAFTMQRPRHGFDLHGALNAAAPLCTGRVLVVLPDQTCDWDQADNPLQYIVRSPGWAVLAAPLSDPAALTAEGALRVEPAETGKGHVVVLAAEKPADPAPFNSAWVAFGLPAADLPRLGEVFRPEGPSPLVGAVARHVTGYRNLTRPEDV